ncbi:MAG: hypothetical protein Q7S47_02370 [bacterium]|nr:hypothetical protein [bacterium]
MKKKNVRGKVISLKDVEVVIQEWRDSCVKRGETPVGLFKLASLDKNCKKFTDVRYRLFGCNAYVEVFLETLNDVHAAGLETTGTDDDITSPFEISASQYGDTL